MKMAVPASGLIVGLGFAGVCAAQVPTGPDFRVNTYTTGHQYDPRLAVESDGDFVVTWTTLGSDGDGTGAVGQRFDAAGVPRGGEFVINSYTTGDQGSPVPAVHRSGAFVVAWNDGRGIHARHFDTRGQPIGSEFQVDTYTTGLQYRAKVARNANTQFVVTWVSEGADGSGFGIAARPFLSTFEPSSPELVVNGHTTGHQSNPSVAMNRDGLTNFVVVWEDAGRDGSGSGIFGRKFDLFGNPYGADFAVNTYTTGDQFLPSVSISPGGRFVVAWSSNGVDGDSVGVVARRFEANGVPIGTEFVVNSYTTSIQSAIFEAVSHDLEGNFVILWKGSAPGSLFGQRMFGQRFYPDGSRRGLEFAVNSDTTGIHAGGVVRSDAIGNFVATWQETTGADGDRSGAFGRRFGGLFPRSMRVDTTGNGVIEAGEIVDVRPTWSNTGSSAQAFSGTFTWTGGPTAPQHPTVLDGAGSYGTVAAGAAVECVDCYGVSFPAVPRTVLHWDERFLEGLAPDAQGQRQPWSLHVGESFSDVPKTSPFYRFVETMLHHDVTTGCSPTEFCPASPTTREQMAVFLLLADGGGGWLPPACGAPPMFADVPASSPYCRFIEEIARRGVTGGCGGGDYCPTSPVSREQLAAFVLRTAEPTLDPAPCGTPLFSDVPAASPFCRWIEELARRGVVAGCGGGAYCPTLPVTRQEMSVFLSATFGLQLYGPALLP